MNCRGCRQRFLPLPDLSRKIEGDSVRRVPVGTLVNSFLAALHLPLAGNPFFFIQILRARLQSQGAFDWEIWIQILKSGFPICNRTRNPKTDFNAEISVYGFSFLSFDWEIRKRIGKTVLKNSGLARARILSKKKTTVHENSFANPFSDFPIER